MTLDGNNTCRAKPDEIRKTRATSMAANHARTNEPNKIEYTKQREVVGALSRPKLTYHGT